MRIVFLAVLLHLTAFSGAFAQSWGTVTGRVTEQGTNAPIPYATVLVSQTNFGTAADGDGYYTLPLPFGHHVLRFSAVGYASLFDTLHVRPSSTLQWDTALAVLLVQMDSIVVEVAAAPLEAGVYRIDPEHLRALPTAFRDGFRIIKSMPGVTTNNELTNEYSVRGGSYNENLVFVNGYEVFKPFRTRKGEQEGLGIVNPDLAQRLTFYSGGFPARYGGKLSSALDVVYRRPERETITGNAYASLLDAGVAAGASALDNRLGWVFGLRYMQARHFFNTQDLRGDYGPQFFDAQGALSYRLAPGHEIEALGLVMRNQFTLDPTNRTTYFGATQYSVLEALFRYDGTDKDRYLTQVGGLRLKTTLSERMRMEHDVSVFKTDEQEQIRFSAATLLNEITIDPVTFEETRTELGHFSQAEQADNRVRVTTWTGRGRYQVYTGRHVTEAGWSLRRLRFDDRLFEREDVSELSNIPDTLYLARLDSLIELGYFERPDTLIATQYQGTANLHTSQAGGYLQSSFDLLSQRDRLVVTLGVRADYFSFNGEWTVSPRASARFRLAERTTLTGSWGLYHQAPTYRELRGEPQPGHPLPASLNRRLHAQRSVQYVAGIEHFTRRRRLTWRAEVYYKQLARLISYDLNNVRTSYSGNNDSEGYTYGLDVQVRGEFVPGLESWVSYSYLVARERFLPAFQTPDNQGWLPRPTDQRHTYTLFIEDYLPGRPTWKLNMRLLFGSGFAYTKPSLVQEADGSIGLAPGLRNARRSPWFLRTDIGAAKRFTLSFGKQKAVLELAAELLNTFDTVTAIDFLWVPRSDGSLLSLPLRTTPRTFNLRARVDF